MSYLLLRIDCRWKKTRLPAPLYCPYSYHSPSPLKDFFCLIPSHNGKMKCLSWVKDNSAWFIGNYRRVFKKNVQGWKMKKKKRKTGFCDGIDQRTLGSRNRDIPTSASISSSLGMSNTLALLTFSSHYSGVEKMY